MRARRSIVVVGGGLLLFLILLLSFEPAMACTVCFGESDSKLAEGANKGIITLLGVTGVILFGFAMFFINLMRRASAGRKEQE